MQTPASITSFLKNGMRVYFLDLEIRRNTVLYSSCMYSKIKEIFCFIYSVQFSDGYFWSFLWWFYSLLVLFVCTVLFYHCLYIQYLPRNIINECVCCNTCNTSVTLLTGSCSVAEHLHIQLSRQLTDNQRRCVMLTALSTVNETKPDH